MTKIDIIQNVYEKLGFSKKESADIVESVFDIIKDSLAHGRKGEDFRLRKFHGQGKTGPAWP